MPLRQLTSKLDVDTYNQQSRAWREATKKRANIVVSGDSECGREKLLTFWLADQRIHLLGNEKALRTVSKNIKIK